MAAGMPDVGVRAGIDVGGSKIAAALYAADGTCLKHERVATPASYDAMLAAVRGLAQGLGDGPLGIGAPGSADPANGLWRNSNMTYCNGRPLQADLEARLGRPLRLANDANCFALSEARHGAGRGHRVVAFFTIGTGLGGGIVVDGRLLAGAHGEAAEFGHMGLPWMDAQDWPPVPCFCGKAGCTEMYVSGTGLEADYARHTSMARRGPDVVALARRNDVAALAALGRLQQRFARVVANLINCIDPDVFVVGGGMASLPELVEDLPPHAARFTFSGKALPLIRRAAFDDSGVRGAALLWEAGASVT